MPTWSWWSKKVWAQVLVPTSQTLTLLSDELFGGNVDTCQNCGRAVSRTPVSRDSQAATAGALTPWLHSEDLQGILRA